jgi:hypothetical protein
MDNQWIEISRIILPNITSLVLLYLGVKIKKNVHSIHLEINSKMSKFIREAKKSSYAAGKLEGRKRRK